jgi:hypothetical protein
LTDDISSRISPKKIDRTGVEKSMCGVKRTFKLKSMGNLIIIVLLAEGEMPEETVQPTSVNPFYWEKLAELHPTDVCNRSEAVYHPSREGFVLMVYNQRYLVLPRPRKILQVEGNDQPMEKELPFFLSLMILAYLLEVKEVKPSHTWVSGKDLKGGSTFFRGPHSFDMKDLEDRYGKDPEAFLRAGRELGGSEVLFGDKGFSLEVFPKVPVAYVLWKGDEEFSPRVNVLFDSTIQDHLPLDIIWCMVTETTRRLVEKQQG